MTDNTKSRPGEYDALEKARPDELIFTLLERDPDAPATIIHWCDLRRKRARDIKDEDKRKAELRQISEAEFIAIEMQDRQRGIADEAEPEGKALYSGETMPVDPAADSVSKLRGMLGDADYWAHEALAMANKAREAGAEMVDDQLHDIIKNSASALHTAALELSPHRAALLAEKELPLEGES